MTSRGGPVSAVEPRRGGQDRAAKVPKSAIRSSETASTPIIQRAGRCTCGGSGGDCEECRRRRLQLRVAGGATFPQDGLEIEAERAAASVTSGITVGPLSSADTAGPVALQRRAGLIVADDAGEVGPGQARRRDFLSQLRAGVCTAADEALAATGRSSEGCPYLDSWFAYYAEREPEDIERAIARYAPETHSAASASDYVGPIIERVARSVRTWAATGAVTGVPPDVAIGALGIGEVATGLSEAASAVGAGIGSAASAVASGVSGVVGGAASALSGAASLFFKARSTERSPDADPTAVRAELGSGQALDVGVRGRMERAFRHDFGSVRVHTDGSAASLADRLEARAFTVGSDVAFGRGEYRPGSLAGDALIAHELAHTVQQRGGGNSTTAAFEADADQAAVGALTVGRAPVLLGGGLALQRCRRTPALPPPPPDRPPPEYQILGRNRAPADINHLYFERNDATLAVDELTKIPTIVSSRPAGTPLTLNGFRSEDEPAALAGTRVAAVEGALAAAVPPAGPRTPMPKPTASLGRSDYRNVRMVEVITSGGVSREPDCDVMPANFPCPPPYETAYTGARTRALTWIDAARALLAPPMSPTTATLLQRYFHSTAAADAATVRANLLLIKNQITALAPAARHRCGNQCDRTCGSAIAYNTHSGAAAVMTMCLGYDSRDPEDNARNLIHEAAHGTPGMTGASLGGTKDVGYRHERMIEFLTTAQALNNSDSYSIFVMWANAVVPADVPATDTPVGMSPLEFQTTRNSVGLLEKWLTWSEQDLNTTFDTVKTSKPPAGAWTNPYYRDVMGVAAASFPELTAPPALPNDDDQMMLAGIHDRLEKLHDVATRDLTFEKTAGPVAWAPGPGSRVTVTGPFLAAGTPESRALDLLAQLILVEPTIVAGHRSRYRTLVDGIRARH